MAVHFKPSQVSLDFRNSSLQKGEKEAWAAMFVNYLAKNGDEWVAVEWSALGRFIVGIVKKDEETPSGLTYEVLHATMVAGPAGGRNAVAHFHQLLAEGYFSLDEDKQLVTATDKALQFYAQYVS